MNINRITGFVWEYIQIAFGVLLASIGLKAFLLPNGFLDGGVTGIALLIKRFVNIELSYLLILFSIPFLILGLYTVSRRIVVKSIISILALALVIHFENFGIITDDELLISIFGGLFLGAGIGIAIRNGSVLDGSEILGIYINDKFGISIGQVILVFNIILFLITALLISTEIALYSILTYIVTAKVTDLTIEGFEDFIGVTIVSKHFIKIEEAIINDLGVGLTIYKGTRGVGYSGKQEDIDIIHVIINRIDIKKMYRMVNQIDEKAFIVEFDVNSVKGGVLRHYLDKKKTKKFLKKTPDTASL